MRISHVLARVGLSAACLLAAIAPASAYDTSASGGLFIEKSGDTTAGVILTQHIRSILHVPGFRTQVSLAAPLATGGRYAASLEWAPRLLKYDLCRWRGRTREMGPSGFNRCTLRSHRRDPRCKAHVRRRGASIIQFRRKSAMPGFSD